MKFVLKKNIIPNITFSRSVTNVKEFIQAQFAKIQKPNISQESFKEKMDHYLGNKIFILPLIFLELLLKMTRKTQSKKTQAQLVGKKLP